MQWLYLANEGRDCASEETLRRAGAICVAIGVQAMSLVDDEHEHFSRTMDAKDFPHEQSFTV